MPDEQQAAKLTAQQVHDDVLDADDVLGKRIVSTQLRGNVTIREAHATAALEVMSRFAANPKWLIYLPPTMSPCETSSEPGLLEHPAEAFGYYRSLSTLARLCREDPDLLLASSYKVVDVTDPAKVVEGTAWWIEQTVRGGEGMVVKLGPGPLRWASHVCHDLPGRAQGIRLSFSSRFLKTGYLDTATKHRMRL